MSGFAFPEGHPVAGIDARLQRARWQSCEIAALGRGNMGRDLREQVAFLISTNGINK